MDDPADRSNVRVWNLLNRGWCFVRLAEHPAALHCCGGLLGWPCSCPTSRPTSPDPEGTDGDARRSALHAAAVERSLQGANVVWMADDFTAGDLCTRVVPGSRRHQRTPGPVDQTASRCRSRRRLARCVMDGRVWHHTGDNVTAPSTRGGIFGCGYTILIYRTQENWSLSLDPLVVQQASDTMSELLGYRCQGLGLVNGVAGA
ncbi:MAG: hypothetical protein R2713_00090 [Ilumatobacteraceae bacterium]